MRILVVEDDEQTAAYMVKGLTESGYVVDRADNGRDGLFLATSSDFDAVVVDRMLPALDGLSRIEALLRRRSGPAVVTKLAVGDLEMDLLGRSVRRAGRAVDLQPREFRLLE